MSSPLFGPVCTTVGDHSENSSDIFFLVAAASYLIGAISGPVAKAQATKAGLAG
jgi:hypothetical protein